jgi:hypothetical protein
VCQIAKVRVRINFGWVSIFTQKGGSYDVTVLKGDDYVTRVNLYMSRFSDGVLISYSTVYK